MNIRITILILISTCTLWSVDKDLTLALRLPGGGYWSKGYSTELLPIVVQKKITENTAISFAPFLFYQNSTYTQGITHYGLTLRIPTYTEDIDTINLFEGFYFGPSLYYVKTHIDHEYKDIQYEYTEATTTLCLGGNIGYGWSFLDKGFINFDLIFGYMKKEGFGYKPENGERTGAVGTMYIGWELY